MIWRTRPCWRFGRWLALLVLTTGLLLALDAAWPPPVERARQISALALDRQGRILRAFTAPPGV